MVDQPITKIAAILRTCLCTKWTSIFPPNGIFSQQATEKEPVMELGLQLNVKPSNQAFKAQTSWTLLTYRVITRQFDFFERGNFFILF